MNVYTGSEFTPQRRKQNTSEQECHLSYLVLRCELQLLQGKPRTTLSIKSPSLVIGHSTVRKQSNTPQRLPHVQKVINMKGRKHHYLCENHLDVIVTH